MKPQYEELGLGQMKTSLLRTRISQNENLIIKISD